MSYCKQVARLCYTVLTIIGMILIDGLALVSRIALRLLNNHSLIG